MSYSVLSVSLSHDGKRAPVFVIWASLNEPLFISKVHFAFCCDRDDFAEKKDCRALRRVNVRWQIAREWKCVKIYYIFYDFHRTFQKVFAIINSEMGDQCIDNFVCVFASVYMCMRNENRIIYRCLFKHKLNLLGCTSLCVLCYPIASYFLVIINFIWFSHVWERSARQ